VFGAGLGAAGFLGAGLGVAFLGAGLGAAGFFGVAFLGAVDFFCVVFLGEAALLGAVFLGVVVLFLGEAFLGVVALFGAAFLGVRDVLRGFDNKSHRDAFVNLDFPTSRGSVWYAFVSLSSLSVSEHKFFLGIAILIP
jgi:hypothetical protein